MYFAAPQIIAKVVWPPIGAVIAENCQADNAALVMIVQQGVVLKHAPGKILFVLPLHFYVDANPRFLAIFTPYFDQFIHPFTSRLAVADNFLQFLVQKFVAA